MGRYIDVDKAIQQIRKQSSRSVARECAVNAVNNTPIEDVAPVIHAHWVKWKEPKVTNPVYKCSNCGFDITVDKYPNVSVGFWIDDFRYCLCCGAKMDEE